MLKDKILKFHQNIEDTHYKGFSFYNKSNEIRNKFAHDGGSLTNNDIKNLINKFNGILANIQSELNYSIKKIDTQNKKLKRFEKFGNKNFGDEIQRKTTTESIKDALDDSVPIPEKISFPDNQASIETEKYLEPKTEHEKSLLEFAKQHDELREQISADIIEHINSSYEQTDITAKDNPFTSEAVVLNQVSQKTDDELLKSISEIQQKLLSTQTGKDNDCNFDFYKTEYKKLLNDKNEKNKQSQNEVLARNFKSDLQKSFNERYTNWQLKEIDKWRKLFLEELYKKIEQFRKLKNLLSPFINNFGMLWDLSDGVFQNCGFEILNDFAEVLENDKSLQELAELIGRESSETEIMIRELREKIELKTEYHPKPAYKGQISGIRLSGELSSVLPSELAMSQSPTTQMYFAKKFAEKRLLSYQYINRQKQYKTETKTEEIEVPQKQKKEKGPVIICVDTSGSMSGTPEQVAKTITFAIAKKCLEQNRSCYLISFSTNIQVKNLTEVKHGQGLNKLLSFLRMSFNGGTDVEPALNHSLKMLSDNDWKNADVLVVSDMVMGNLSATITNRIKAQQEKETKFYSLVIGETGNKNVIDVFDENWSYNTNAKDSMHHLVRQIQKITP